MKKLLTLCTALITLTATAHDYHGGELEKIGTKSLSLPVSGVEQFTIEAGAGSLTLIGHNNDVIEVTADIYQQDKGDPYCLSLGQSKDKKSHAKLKANTCHNNNHTKINVAVYLPKNLLTQISDGSGPINIENVSVFSINDGSGEIVIDDNLVAIDINDGSGKIEVNNQRGELNINDGSGSVDVENVDGDITITDGSGSINISNVAGKVSVTDGSGSISVNNANDFILLADGSGQVNVKNINNRK